MVPLIFSQLVPPHIKNAIRRVRLFELGCSILSHQVALITAPAGYGKSVWIASLVEEKSWPDTAWLSLDHYDRETSFLLYHIIYSLQRVLPDFGHQALRTMNSLEDVATNWEIALASLMEEMPRDKNLVLVLDDFHLLDENSKASLAVEQLIRWMPPSLHLVLISRTRPSLSLYREQLRGQLLEINSDCLSFSLEESCQVLEKLGLQMDGEELALIQASTEGWPVGLRLLGIMLLQSGKDVRLTLQELQHQGSSLHTYLSNEFMAYLPRNLREFLLNSSLLPYMEPGLCDAALSIDNSLDNIRELHAYGLLSRVEDADTTWRMHHLMGEFLERKMILEADPDRVAAIRQRASSYLESKGDIDRALDQLAAGCAWNGAARLLRQYGDPYFLQSGRLDSLYAWIERLPDRMVANDHWLLFFKAMSLVHVKPEQALDTLSRGADTAEQQGDIRCQLRSLLAMLAVYTFANNLDKIRETAARMPVLADQGDAWVRSMMLVVSLGRAAWADDLHEGVYLSRMAEKSQLDPESRMAYLMFSSIIQYRMGNLATARDLAVKLLSDPYVRENERWTGTAYVIYSIICWLSGEHVMMEEICGHLIRLGQKYQIPHQLGMAHRRLAHQHLFAGRLDQARTEFEQSRNAFTQANNIFFAYLTDLDLLWLQIQAGENPQDRLPETGRILSHLQALPGGQGLDDYALSIAAIIALEAKHLELAAAYLEQEIEHCTAKGARQILAGAQFLLARVRLWQGDEGSCDLLLNRALGAAETEGWEFFWDWHEESMYALCQRALLKKIHPAWAAYLLRRWFARRIYKEAGLFLVGDDEVVARMFSQMLQDLVRERGAPVVHVFFLGSFEVFVNGLKIPAGKWKTKKAETLFKFLVTHRHNYPKEAVAGILWPEVEQRRGDASLRMALSHARQALGLSNMGWDSLQVKRGLVSLDPELEVYSDYELFMSLTQKAFRDQGGAHPLTVELLEQARQLYRGDFLPENLYDDWSGDLRRMLYDLYLQVLARLVDAYRLQDRWNDALEACQCYLALEPLNEELCKNTMELLWQKGQKEQALALYRELASSLEKDFGIKPNSELYRLYEKIRLN